MKFKEISYIHSEAFAAGEMKHGPISLVEKGTLVVGILTQPDLFEKSVSNMVEVKSRGAFLMGLTTYGNYSIETLRASRSTCQDRPALCHEPVGHSAAAAGLLRQLRQGIGCR